MKLVVFNLVQIRPNLVLCCYTKYPIMNIEIVNMNVVLLLNWAKNIYTLLP